MGSKSHWVETLNEFKGEKFVELFCGSAVLSANLASEAILNDVDPVVYKILKNFEHLIVPKVFTKADYFLKRSSPEWWKYVYCFQKMSFSGVFRYSKNGYNVPVKKEIESISVRKEYLLAKRKYKKLKPLILNQSYLDVPLEMMTDKVVVLDPPYEGSKAAYNVKFDYEAYWKRVEEIKQVAKVVLIFDSVKNLKKQNIPVYKTRKLRVNGARPGDEEGMAIFVLGKYLNPEDSIKASRDQIKGISEDSVNP